MTCALTSLVGVLDLFVPGISPTPGMQSTLWFAINILLARSIVPWGKVDDV